MRKNKNGFTLVEMMLALAVSVGLLATAFSTYANISLKEKANAEFDRYVQVNEIAKANTTLQKNIATGLKDAGGGVYYYSTDNWAKTGVVDQYVLNGVIPGDSVSGSEYGSTQKMFLNKFGGSNIAGEMNYILNDIPIQACDIFLQRWKLYKNLKSSVGAKTCAEMVEMVGDGDGDKVTIVISLADVSLNEENISKYLAVFRSSGDIVNV
jgi:prepilin-type N-terminal cleavage/methylation domain-containing protein